MDKDARISFRADSAVQAGLARFAEQQGCSVSEFIRQSVEERIARVEAANSSLAALNPYSKLSAAARGDIEAQRAIAESAASIAFETNAGGELLHDPFTVLTEGLVFARLAASQGGIAEQGLVIAMLSALAELCAGEASDDAMAEAIARVEHVANLEGTGSEDAAQWLPALIDACAPEIAARASALSKHMKQEAAQ